MASNTTTPELPPGSFDSRVPTVIGVVTFTLSVATLFVGLRIYTRAVVIKQLGYDDLCAVIALLIAFGCGFAIAYNTNYGLGKHVWMLDPAMVPLYLRTFYVSINLYTSCLMAIKMTFLLQYNRILAVQSMHRVIIAAMVIIGGWSISQIFVGIFVCTPVQGFWDMTVEAKCIPNIPQWYINAAGNIITDVAIFVLPLPAIGKLNLAKPQKLLLLGIFCLGFFTCAISIIRIRYLKLFDDFTWENVESSGWSIGELCCGITCACLPTLRPLVSKYLPALSTRAVRSSRGAGGYRKAWHPSGGSDPASSSDRRTVDRTSRHVSQYGGGATTTTTAGAGGVAARGLSEMDSKDSLYRDGGGGGSSGEVLELGRADSGEGSDGVLGLASTRAGLDYDEDGSDDRGARRQVKRTSTTRQSDEEAMIGLRSTVLTQVKSGPPGVNSPPIAPRLHGQRGGIQVRHEVAQTLSPSTARK